MVLRKRSVISAGVAIGIFLAPLTNIRLGDLQPVDIFLGVVFVGMTAAVLLRGRLAIDRRRGTLLVPYVALLVTILVLALLSARLTFYPPSEAVADPLKTAPILSLAHLFQLVLCVFGSFTLWAVAGNDPIILRRTARLYVTVGILNSLYAIASYLLLYCAQVDVCGAYIDATGVRARGFFNEGGPFGLYVTSVVVVALFERYVLRSRRSLMLWMADLPILMTALLVSGSKAGMIAMLFLLGFAAITRLRVRYLLGAAAVSIAAFFATPATEQLQTYWALYQNFDLIASARRHDTNIVAGRMAATVVVPELVAAHPLLGTGFGNYPLMRASPEITVPSADVWDVPGAGLLTLAAELGLPTFLFLVVLLAIPPAMMWRSRMPLFVIMLAGYQLVAQTIEVQVTFFYPWIPTSLALGYYHLQCTRSRD
jgi:hypothetical protein